MKSKLALGALLLGLTALFVIFLNPFNWFVSKSSRFSPQNFDFVQSGMRQEQLVDLLGEPLRITEIRAPYYRCEGCFIYYFMGDPPEWLIAYEEAWVYVGPDGLVREKIWNVEP